MEDFPFPQTTHQPANSYLTTGILTDSGHSIWEAWGHWVGERWGRAHSFTRCLHSLRRQLGLAVPLERCKQREVSSLRWFRVVAFFEGVSFILLLFVAMPMKYMMGMPLAVRIVGSAHGGLFLAFVALLLHVGTERSWPLRRSALAFLASLVPFGTFVLDRSLKREEQAQG